MSTSNQKTDATFLGAGFSPSDKDVIVGRGKVCYKHNGNLRLAAIAQSVLGTYSAADATKKSKTELIKSIVTQIREGSPNGGFVKFDSEMGQWFEVGDRIAREKVSQTFRDALTDVYKSSSTSKTLKRRQERITRQTSGESRGSTAEPEAAPSLSVVNPDPMRSLPFASLTLSSAGGAPEGHLVSPLPMASPFQRRRPSRVTPHSSPFMSMASSARRVSLASPGNRSLASPGQRSLASPGHRSLASPVMSMASPHSIGFGTGVSMASPHSAGFGTGVSMPSPHSAGFGTGTGVSMASPHFAGFGAGTPSSMVSSFGGLSTAESPSSIRLAMAIAERKRRLTNMILATRQATPQRANIAAGFNRPQLPQF